MPRPSACVRPAPNARWISAGPLPGLIQTLSGKWPPRSWKQGATVVVTGADTTGPVQAAGEAGHWGVGYDSRNACEVDTEHCLTVPYWNWGPQYVTLINSMIDGTFTGADIYFDVDSGSLGLLGFMEGQEPAAGVPEDVIPQVRELLDQMLAGEFTRLMSSPVQSTIIRVK